jgi:hypothetical protein
MMQVMCSRDTKRICDGSCDDPGCMAKHRPTMTIACGECDKLREELREADALRERMADLLSRTAIALRGPEPPLTRWSWHDLPERAAAAIAAIDVMQRAAATNHAPPNTQANRTNPQG